MDNQYQPNPNQTPVPPRAPKKRSAWKQTAIVAVIAAIIGGAVGGGAVYFGLRGFSGGDLGTTITTQKAGTTQVSNVTLNESGASEKAFAKVEKAVVSVVNLKRRQSTSSGLDIYGQIFGQNGSSRSSDTDNSTLQEASEGSGVIYQKKGDKAYVVTNNHVIAGSDSLEVILSDGTKVAAKLVGTDATSDLAVLTIAGDKVETVAAFGDSSKLKAGQTVLAIGSPLGSDYATSVTQGIVSATNRTIDVIDETTRRPSGQATVIQTDAAINSGNSGGPLINTAGQVIGINSMKLSGTSKSSATIEGMGFAIPSDEVVAIINQLVDKGKVTRPALGVSVRDLATITAEQQKSVLKIATDVKDGAVIAGFTASDPEKAGLAKYDVIVKIDGDNVTGAADLRTALYKHKVGDTVKVTYYHQKDKKTANVKLIEATETPTKTTTRSGSAN